VRYVVDVYRGDTDGTLWVYVEIETSLPTPLRLKPSFVFRKLRDGTAFAIR